MIYGQIIAMAGFLAIIIIIIAALLLKKIREKKEEERKERRSRGEVEPEEKDKKNGGKINKLLSIINTPRILFIVCIYIALLISFSILLPDLWGKYWGDKEFFWVSQVYVVAMIAIRRLDVASIRFVLRVAFSVIIVLYLYGKMSPAPTEKRIKKTLQQEQQVYGNRLATIRDQWSQEFVIPKEGGTLRIKRVDPSIPLECLVTLIDDNDTKKIFKIPGVGEGYGDFNLPDSKGLRLRTPYLLTTTVWIIIKPL